MLNKGALEPEMEKVRVALASGSVALKSPMTVPIGWFSKKLNGAELFRSVGAALAVEFASAGLDP